MTRVHMSKKKLGHPSRNNIRPRSRRINLCFGGLTFMSLDKGTTYDINTQLEHITLSTEDMKCDI